MNKDRGRVSPAVENLASPDISGVDFDLTDEGVVNGEQNKLKSSSPLSEIIDAMMHTDTSNYLQELNLKNSFYIVI